MLYYPKENGLMPSNETWQFLLYRKCLLFPFSHQLSICMKCVQIRSFFWSVFSCIQTEYGDLQSEYRKIWTRKNSVLDIFHAVQKQPPDVFYEKGILKNFANFTGKHLCWSLFLINLQAFRPATLWKRDSIGVFLWNLRNF